MWSGLGQVGSGVAPSVQASSVLLLDTANLIRANLAGKGWYGRNWGESR